MVWDVEKMLKTSLWQLGQEARQESLQTEQSTVRGTDGRMGKSEEERDGEEENRSDGWL